MAKANSLMTSAQIALHLQVKNGAVRHILGSRDIKPVHVAGLTGLYDAAAVALVKSELDAMTERRTSSKGQFKKAAS